MAKRQNVFLPLETNSRVSMLLVAVGVLFLSLFSQLEIPIGPVPITAQSFMVVAVGALLGPIIGTAATLVWLACGAAGLPVLAGGTSGLSHFGGPTAGFILAFPIATILTGWLVSRRLTNATLARAGWVFLVAVIAHIVCLVLGVIWLSLTIGFSAALENGFYPFIPGGIIKSAAVALLVLAVERALQQRRR